MIDGSVQIDGYYKHEIGIGDVFFVRAKPELSLKCIRFVDWKNTTHLFIVRIYLTQLIYD